MAEAAKKEKSALSVANQAPVTPSRDWMGVLMLTLVTVNLIALSAMGYFIQKMWGQVHSVSELAKSLTVEKEPAKEAPGFGKEIEPHKIGTLYPLDNILVNITSDQGPKFLQVQMDLELNDPALEAELKTKKPIVRDAILVLLSSRSYKELREPSGLKTLRADLMRAINNVLSSGK